MKILIIDGNEKAASDRYTKLGMQTQYEVYKTVLENISKIKLDIFTIHPACSDNFLSKGLNLGDFDGIVWTGSVLNIYDQKPSIDRQIELAKVLMNKKNKIFGSCWGLQVLATAAGGKVRKNPKGLEAIIAKDIKLNHEGILHPMYKNKPLEFNAFCWHYDEIETLPNETTVLSSNNRSEVQSFCFNKDKSEVWAVQYHPEFNPPWMSGLMNQREQILLDEGIFNNQEEFNSYKNYFSDINKFSKLKKELKISDNLIDEKIHSLELFNWLNHLKNPD